MTTDISHYLITRTLPETLQGSPCMVCHEQNERGDIRGHYVVDHTAAGNPTSYSCVKCVQQWFASGMEKAKKHCVMCQRKLQNSEISLIQNYDTSSDEREEKLSKIENETLKSLYSMLFDLKAQQAEVERELIAEQEKYFLPGLYDWRSYTHQIKRIQQRMDRIKVAIYQMKTSLNREKQYQGTTNSQLFKTSIVYSLALTASYVGWRVLSQFCDQVSESEKGPYATGSVGSFIMGCYAAYHLVDPILELLRRATGLRIGSLNPFTLMFPGAFVE